AEETLYDSEAMRRFAGVELGDDRIPDETTILNFRHLLERYRLGLPLNFHPAGTGALWVDTPTGAGGATDRCAELSGGAARLLV
ncbi:transposase, partial [Roseovarius sp. A46]|uniref:transposase n=1 Tax=Roseovarius sp. A46 TaxID=2109331 RepID=UPI001F504786